MGSLANAYAILTAGGLWSSTGKCKGYAVQNPGEAARITSYVAALDRGERPPPPALATATGRGLVAMLDSLARATPPALHVTISGKPIEGETLKAAIQ